MGVDRLHQPEIELLHQLQIAVDLLEHQVDDERFAAAAAREHVAIGARDAVEQLPEDHRQPPFGRGFECFSKCLSGQGLFVQPARTALRQGKSSRLFDHFVMLDARIEIDQRCDRARLDHRLVDLAPRESLDGAEISPEVSTTNSIVSPLRRLQSSAPANPGRRAISGRTLRRKWAG